ncbi:MAG: glycoside hydrolase family 76 protein [Candidatus Pseudobacter hemicellulosilyticus]|uniref:Glycoside hydrolase family 76 protein n=1 Tax=Candidatus Pseudobacter hemicellulosilyticus TaxID=3121375 RepID=A0AAJ6BJR6_9BACT|nr:MAG: glycoside hydrolase family 76 protein [Pseudobacter sp.]
MKTRLLKLSSIGFLLSFVFIGCSKGKSSDPGTEGPDKGKPEETTAWKNLDKAIALTDKTFEHYFTGDNMSMAVSYNPFTRQRANGLATVWEYTFALETVNAVLQTLNTHKEKGNTAAYNTHYQRYSNLLYKLFDNLDFYEGSYELTTFTQTRSWSIYAVQRATSKGNANVQGRENVYDDQLWLIIELMKSFKLTGDQRFLTKAEYLMQYVLDGWDPSLDASGKEIGGIPWGPGYVTKHSASNGPTISPLVWLHEYYKNKPDEITHRFIKADKSRDAVQMKKSDYYLSFAEKLYAWQKNNMLLTNGVYADMMGGCDDCSVKYETVGGTTYRAHTPLKKADGGENSYNSGTMISAACDLYRVTSKAAYLSDLKTLCTKAYSFFAKPIAGRSGYYEFDDSKGTRVLLWGFMDAYPHNNVTKTYMSPFQVLLDYAYALHLKDGVLPIYLYQGWDDNNKDVNGIYGLSYAAEFALLSKFELDNK